MELPRCFDYCDWSRSYLLPGGVATNIPRRGPGPGAHDHARGLLVELVLRLGATPVSLHYSETAQPRWAYDYSRTAVTAVLDAPGHGPVRVTTFARYWRVATVPETWKSSSTAVTSPTRTAPPAVSALHGLHRRPCSVRHHHAPQRRGDRGAAPRALWHLARPPADRPRAAPPRQPEEDTSHVRRQLRAERSGSTTAPRSPDNDAVMAELQRLGLVNPAARFAMRTSRASSRAFRTSGLSFAPPPRVLVEHV